MKTSMSQLKMGVMLSYVSLGLHNIIGLLYTPFMLRCMGQSEYGLYSLAASIVAYLTILDFGFGDAVVRYTAKFRAEGKISEQYSLFGMIIICYTFIAFITIIFGTILYYNVDCFFDKTMTLEELNKTRLMMILLTINLALTFIFSIFGSIITAYENFIFQKIVYIVRIVLQPCIMIPLLLWGYKAVSMVVVISTLNIICLLINTYYCIYKLNIKVYFSNFNWLLLKEIGSYTFYTFIAFIVYRISWNSGQFVLGALVGTSAIAVYAVAMQLKDFYSNASTAISSVFLPKVTAMITQKISNEEISNLFIRVGRIQYIIMAFILSGFILFGKEFINIWAGKDYEEAYTITLIIMIPLIVPLVQNIGITILQAKNQLKFRSLLYIIVAIIGIALSILLAKKYSGIGCAIGTSISLILGNVIVINIYYWKKIKIDIPRFWKEISQISIPIISITIIYLVIKNNIIYSNSIILIAEILSFAIFYLVFIWKFGMNIYEKELFITFLKGLRKQNDK